MIRVTASGYGLLRRCQWWARPEVPHADDDPGEPAHTGTAAHAVFASVVGDDGREIEPPPEGADRDRVAALGARFAAWWPGFRDAHEGVARWHDEIAIAYDVERETSRILASRGHRDYSDRREGEIVGTVDVYAVDGDRVLVGDWKSGRPENVDPAAHNGQLAILGLALARLAGVERARVFLGFVSESGVALDAHDLDALDLDDAAEEARTLTASIGGSEPNPGRHCTYCPARGACPATAEHALAVAPSANLIPLQRLMRGELTRPEDFGEAHAQIAIVEAAVRDAKARIAKACDDYGDLPLPNGKALRMTTSTRETLSKSSIERHVPPEEAGPLLTRLRELGAFEVSTSRYPKEVRRRG